MDQDELFRRLALALAIGLLIGLERGWQLREEAEGERTAGLRTHALTGLLGGVCAALSVASHAAVLVAGLISFTAAFALFAWLEASSEHNFSVTGVVAAILTFVLGAYAVLGQPLVAVACSVAMVLLLALKEPLHGWIRRLTWLELRAVLVLLAMSFLLLPVLPNRTIDPWDAINPAEIWLLAVLIAGVSFVGYVAVKYLGDQAGIAVAALAGGLTSSTATTLSFARLAREQPQASLVLAGGILLAGVVMIVRVVAIAVALAPTLSSALLVPAAAGAIVLLAAGASLTLARRPAGGGETATLELKNPFDLAGALKLAALIAIIMLLAKMLSSMSSTRGLYLLAAVSGIADLDAITLSMARVAGARVAPAEAATAIIVAVGTNTAAKAVMATAIAGRRVGIAVGACSAVAIIAIAAAHLLVPRLPFADSMATGNTARIF
jgi:uncharacterized membrane protein (DUF4010 family)